MSACFLIDEKFNDIDAVAEATACSNFAVTEIEAALKVDAGACAMQPCPNSSKCSPSGESAENFSCIVQECLETELNNAVISAGMTNVGSKNSFRCKQGYTMFGKPGVFCTSSGGWSQSDFYCYPNCQMPKVPHSDVIQFNKRLAYNTTARLQCHNDYTMVGNPTITCMKTGQWSVQFICYPNCQTPVFINAYSVTLADSFTFNTTTTMQCNNGYTMVGNPSVTCLGTGQWSKAEFSCYPDCLMPNILNAYAITFDGNLAFNTTAFMNCNNGYTLVGNPSITCTATGQWSQEEFVCYPNCHIPSINNADIISFDPSLAYKTVAVLQCHSGFYSTEPLTIICKADGQWSTAECLRYCPNPVAISNAAVVGEAPLYTIGMSVEYVCDIGYYAAEPAETVIYCLSYGSWTVSDLICNKYCTSLPSVENANLVADISQPYTTSSVAVFQCNGNFPFFESGESGEFFCDKYGTWIGTLHCCQLLYSWNESKNKCCLIENLFC